MPDDDCRARRRCRLDSCGRASQPYDVWSRRARQTDPGGPDGKSNATRVGPQVGGMSLPGATSALRAEQAPVAPPPRGGAPTPPGPSSVSDSNTSSRSAWRANPSGAIGASPPPPGGVGPGRSPVGPERSEVAPRLNFQPSLSQNWSAATLNVVLKRRHQMATVCHSERSKSDGIS